MRAPHDSRWKGRLLHILVGPQSSRFSLFVSCITFLILPYLFTCFAGAYPTVSYRTHELTPDLDDHTSANLFLSRGLFTAELYLGTAPYGVRIRPLNLMSPIVTAAGFAQSFYAGVMVEALERIEDGTGRFVELRFVRGELFLSFEGMIRRAVDWEMIYEFAKWMRDRAELGLVGTYHGVIFNERTAQYVEIVCGIISREGRG